MKPTLDEQDMTVYASDAQTIQEPYGSDYSQGVRVGRTIPAKWWNWLFRAVTSRLHQAYLDILNLFTEATNLLLDVGITPDASDSTQLSQAIAAKADVQVSEYVEMNKLRGFKYWEPTANNGLLSRNNDITEFESGVLVSYGNRGSRSQPYTTYSTDGGENWANFNEGNASNFTRDIPICFVNNLYIFQVSTVGTTLSIQESANITGVVYPYNPIATINLTDTGDRYATFTIVLGTDVYIMTRPGALIKYDSATKILTDTGITAADLGLSPSTFIDYTPIEAVEINGRYFAGNLMFDGTVWRNVCTTMNSSTFSPTPFNTVAHALRSGDKVYFTCSISHGFQALKVPVYDFSTDSTSVLPYYTWYNQVDDVLLCLKDFENGDYTLMFSYDGATFTDTPIVPRQSSRFQINVIQLSDGYLIKCPGSVDSAYLMYYIKNTLSDDITKYEVRSLEMLQGNLYLVRAFKQSDICFLLDAGNNAIFTHQTGYRVFGKGERVEVIQARDESHYYRNLLIPPSGKELMPAYKRQPFSAFLTFLATGTINYVVSKASVNTVANNTLYLR